ncbi:DoxX family protein [Streptomyces kaniharaensis]|uniref:DoxX family protein n=1 Tax=Streptomyces kaniharaensis TaxID=212423 RepID=A0A6N7KTD2_9ACTN|nr:DoxX family protein [Streptomyces kaniharaensis]MQS13597.1 DoxX family protein [Streptomyces kaniharaensis]
MSVAHTIVTVLGALMAGFSAGAVFFKAEFVVGPLAEYGVPRAWWTWLGVAKAAGAIGLLVGFVVPVIGELAAIGLVLYFTGAVITVLRARAYAHVPFPIIYAVPAAASLVLGLAA